MLLPGAAGTGAEASAGAGSGRRGCVALTTVGNICDATRRRHVSNPAIANVPLVSDCLQRCRCNRGNGGHNRGRFTTVVIAAIAAMIVLCIFSLDHGSTGKR